MQSNDRIAVVPHPTYSRWTTAYRLSPLPCDRSPTNSGTRSCPKLPILVAPAARATIGNPRANAAPTPLGNDRFGIVDAFLVSAKTLIDLLPAPSQAELPPRSLHDIRRHAMLCLLGHAHSGSPRTYHQQQQMG
jgi:hypothetical protein